MTHNPYVPSSKQKAQARHRFSGCLSNQNFKQMYNVIKNLTENGGYVTMPIISEYVGIGRDHTSKLLQYWRGVDKPDNIEWKMGEEYLRVLYFYRDTTSKEPHSHTVQVGERSNDVADRIRGLKSSNQMKGVVGTIDDQSATPQTEGQGHPKQGING